jgi:AcrR family transcriptional regulator
MTRVKRRVAGEVRKAQLLDVAKQAFAERPYDELSMDDIAHASKISKALLYHHFPTKRDLYVAALSEQAEELADVITKDLAEPAPIDRVRSGLDRYLEYIARHSSLFLSLARSGIGSDPAVSDIKARFRDRVINEILSTSPFAAMSEPIVHVATRGWLGFVEAASIEWCVSPTLSRTELRDLLTQSLFDTLKYVVLALQRR